MIRKYTDFLIKESVEEKVYYKPTNIIQEICVSMLLFNNQFLDNILDRGLKARYTENSQVFLTDLKNLVLAKNRLNLGKFVDNKCVADEEVSKLNGFFDDVQFDIEKDWNKLVNSRITARNIIDKLLQDEKITEDMIVSVYWLGPNKTLQYNEDIVLELTDGRQYSLYLNKNLNASKTASFNTFADDLIGMEVDKLYKEEYIPKWDKLIQQWVRTIYDNANQNIKLQIEKFIDEDRIDSLGYFNYFKLRHRDPRYKHLGEFMKEFNKNILDFSDLMNEIWKNKESCFIDVETVYNTWMETKVFILNSKILEHLFTESITKNNIQDIKRLEDGLKLAGGKIKMKLIKTLVEKLGCSERTTYYLGNNGNNFNQVPSRDFFRKVYNDLDIKFDYHVKMVVEEEEADNDFKFKIFVDMDKNPLLDFEIIVKFSSGEVGSKLSAKYKFNLADDFNLKISNKINKA